jgi:hypothetical protein
VLIDASGPSLRGPTRPHMPLLELGCLLVMSNRVLQGLDLVAAGLDRPR